MTRQEAEQVVTQDAFGIDVGGEDWIEVVAPEIHVVRRAERRARNPLSFTRLVEFLECPACWKVRTEGRRFRMPETKEMLVSSVIRDLVAYSHTPKDKEKIRFRWPGKLLNYMRYFYLDGLKESELGERVFEYLKKKREERKEKPWEDEKERDEETKGFIMEATSEEMVRYYLNNYWTIVESQRRLMNFELEEGIPMTVVIDQIRKIPTGEVKKKMRERRRKFKRQIFGLKMRVGEERSRLSLQTGIQLLAYKAVYPKGEPEIVVYDFATGRKLVRRGGDENLLIEGLVCVRRAMDLGFDEEDPSHEHYEQLGERPESHTETGPEFERMKLEGKIWHEAAKQVFKAYDESCEWEEVSTPVFITREDGDFRIFPLEGNCHDCGSALRADLDGAIYCSTEGEERRFGKFPKDAEKIGLGGYLSSSN